MALMIPRDIVPPACPCPPCVLFDAALREHCNAVHAGRSSAADRERIARLARAVDLAHGLASRRQTL
jgi:hypothetical protein